MARDYFISYTRADLAWAEWIATTIEAAGYSTYIQKWDFEPGGNFLLDMHRAITDSHKTLLVMSKNFFGSMFTQPEWAAALVEDPMGHDRRLLPVRVDRCRPIGLLAAITFVDLVGTDEPNATTRLLSALKPIPREASSPSPFSADASTPAHFPSGPELDAPIATAAKRRQLAQGQYLLDSLDTKGNSGHHSRSIAILDVDGMSGINKKYGTDIGDAVVQELLAMLEAYFGVGNSGRCGDDTFFAVVTRKANEARARLDRFIDTASRHNWSESIIAGLRVTVSASIAEFTPAEKPLYTVIRAALGCRNAQLQGRAKILSPPRFIPDELHQLLIGEPPLSRGVSLVHSTW